jgi:hypothetical protein
MYSKEFTTSLKERNNDTSSKILLIQNFDIKFEKIKHIILLDFLRRNPKFSPKCFLKINLFESKKNLQSYKYGESKIEFKPRMRTGLTQKESGTESEYSDKKQRALERKREIDEVE